MKYIPLMLLLASSARSFPAALTPAQKTSLDEHVPFGLPSNGELLFRTGYVLSHDNWLKIPRWSAYHVSSSTIRGPGVRRDNFHAEQDLQEWQRAVPSDYNRTGYDQGHMAPAAAMKRSQKAMDESFSMANMVPQPGIGFNRHIWAHLEDKVRNWALAKGEGWVFVGPAFLDADDDGDIEFKLIGKSRVAVPTHNFMALVTRAKGGEMDAIAFLLPNIKLKDDQLPTFIVDMKTIERATGLDFLAELPDDQEDELEAKKQVNLWPE